MWALPYPVTLGSTVRVKGILQEARAHLPGASRKLLEMRGSELILRLPAEGDGDALVARVAATLAGAEALPVIPREIEDILGITSTERRRWLADGRLPSAGTRTVKLRGRARQITFHVFDPAFVADALDRDLVVDWREQDIETAAESRRRAAWARQQQRLLKTRGPEPDTAATLDDTDRPNLVGWDEWQRTGLLR